MKYTGYYLLATGIIHNLIGLGLGWDTLVAMHADGWLSATVVNGEMLFDREAISWFLITGTFWILFGLTLQKALNEGFQPPLSLGIGFIAIGIVIAILMPVSGAYLFIVQGVLLVLGTQRVNNDNDTKALL